MITFAQSLTRPTWQVWFLTWLLFEINHRTIALFLAERKARRREYYGEGWLV